MTERDYARLLIRKHEELRLRVYEDAGGLDSDWGRTQLVRVGELAAIMRSGQLPPSLREEVA